MDRDAQIKAIEQTFEDTKKPIEKHYSKPNVVPVEVLPVYPDFKVSYLSLSSMKICKLKWFRLIYQLFKNIKYLFRPCGKESTEVQITQNKGKESEDSYQKLKRSP